MSPFWAMWSRGWCWALWLLGGVACAASPPHEPSWSPAQASYYSARFVGKRTASGEVYRKEVFSAAHRSLPLGSLVTVRNPRNHRTVVVRINDRGPHKPLRDMDLSHATARYLGLSGRGVARVEWRLAPKGARVHPPLSPVPPRRVASRPKA